MEENILFFKKLKDEAIIIRRSSELGGNADLISVMNMIMLKQFYEKLSEKDEIAIEKNEVIVNEIEPEEIKVEAETKKEIKTPASKK